MKYMLLMSYGPIDGVPPATEWDPEDLRAHIRAMGRIGEELAERGELVDAQGLAGPDRARIVTADGVAPPFVTDGPFAESKEFLAGYWLVDVESEERAVEIAAAVSAAPGPGGRPVRQPVEVRPIGEVPPQE